MFYPNKELEECCLEVTHVEQVIQEIRKNHLKYFNLFIETSGGVHPSKEQIAKIEGELDLETNTKKSFTDNFKYLIQQGIHEFEKDRESYEEFFGKEFLEEYEDNPIGFKSALSKDCGVIRVTLQNKDSKLDGFKRSFRLANPNHLLDVLTNITTYVLDYHEKWEGFDYNGEYSVQELFDDILELDIFDEEGYGVYGVVGGGIKSYIAHKLNPQYFVHRSREGIWALWYLTGKKIFGCEQDSEFLMINVEDAVTHQNYYYPYGMFAVYAYEVYKLLLNEANKYEVDIPEKYRYVIVNSFLKFIALHHDEEILTLSKNIREGEFVWV